MTLSTANSKYVGSKNLREVKPVKLHNVIFVLYKHNSLLVRKPTIVTTIDAGYYYDITAIIKYNNN